MGRTAPPSSGASCHQSHLQTTITGSAFGTSGAGDIQDWHSQGILSIQGSCPALSLLELYKLLKINLTALPPLTAQASPRVTVFFYSSCKDSNFILFLPEFIILIMKQLLIWKRKKTNTSKRMVSILNLFYFMQNTL